MKKTLFCIALAAICSTMNAQIYKAKKCEISIFKATAIEDIAGVNKITSPLLNIATGDLQMKLVITSFMFEKPLMQEHFNETYMESDKFPNAFFKGKINEKIDYTKDGEHKVTATGKFTIHGVEKEKTINGTITIKGQEITLASTFTIVFSDYGVEIPALQSPILGEDIGVKIYAVLEPFKKN
jgi:polyisoprenoid-binding protein YceI